MRCNNNMCTFICSCVGIGKMMLKEIQEELQTQHNRSTVDPIFIVYDWDKLPTTEDYCEDWEYADTDDGYRAIGKTKDDILKYCKEYDLDLPSDLEELSAGDFILWLKEIGGYDSLMKNHYFKRRIFKGVFFTEKAANAFIERNRHHFSDEVHTYVHSLYGNPEMRFIRNNLLKETLITKQSVEEYLYILFKELKKHVGKEGDIVISKEAAIIILRQLEGLLL